MNMIWDCVAGMLQQLEKAFFTFIRGLSESAVMRCRAGVAALDDS